MEKEYLFAVKVVVNIPDEDDWDEESELITEVESALEDIAVDDIPDSVEIVTIGASAI
jgi:hypothetical protein